MKSEPCPRCFAPAGEDGSPDCACAATVEARRAAAVAVDEVGKAGADSQERGSDAVPPAAGAATEATVEAEVAGAEAEGAAETGAPGPGPARAPAPDPVPGAGDGGTGPLAGSVIDAGGVSGPPAEPEAPGRRKRKNRLIAVAAGVVVAAVAVAAGTGVFGGDASDASGDTAQATNGTALPGGQRGARTPGTATSAEVSQAAGSPSASSSAGGPAKKDGTGASSASASASSSAARQGAVASSPPPATAQGPTAGTASPSGTASAPSGPPVLQEGDSGPQVVELQKRLGQLLLGYLGAPDGQYDAGVKDAVARYQDAHSITADPSGVYGAATRKDLESRTHTP